MTQTQTETDARQLIRTALDLLVDENHRREDVQALLAAELDEAYCEPEYVVAERMELPA